MYRVIWLLVGVTWAMLSPSIDTSAVLLSTCSDPSMFPSGVCNMTTNCSVSVATSNLVLNLDAARANLTVLAYPDPSNCNTSLVWYGVSQSYLQATMTNAACSSNSASRWRNTGRVAYWSSNAEKLTIGSNAWSAVAPTGNSPRTVSFWFRFNGALAVFPLKTYIFDTGNTSTSLGRFAVFISAPTSTSASAYLDLGSVTSSSTTLPSNALDGNTWTLLTVAVGAYASTPNQTPFYWYVNSVQSSGFVVSGQLGTASTALTINAGTGPVLLWDSTYTPSTSGANPVALGMRFRVSQTTVITGLHYYKPDDDTRSTMFQFYDAASGTLLSGTGVVSHTSAIGWKFGSFNPVQVFPGIDYIVSYLFSPTGSTYLIAVQPPNTPGFSALTGSVVLAISGTYSAAGQQNFPGNNGNWYFVEPVTNALIPSFVDLGELRVYTRQISSTEENNNYAATVRRYNPQVATQCSGCAINFTSFDNGNGCSPPM